MGSGEQHEQAREQQVGDVAEALWQHSMTLVDALAERLLHGDVTGETRRRLDERGWDVAEALVSTCERQ